MFIIFSHLSVDKVFFPGWSSTDPDDDDDDDDINCQLMLQIKAQVLHLKSGSRHEGL